MKYQPYFVNIRNKGFELFIFLSLVYGKNAIQI